MVVLAVDPGSKRIGLAASDEAGVVALPLEAVSVGPRGAHIARIAGIAAERRAERVVVGLPLSLDGRSGPAADAARRLAAQIGGATGLPVDLLDERLTTAQAERDLIASGMRRDRRRARVDSAAAAILLQSYLDAAAAASRRRRTPDGE